MADKPMNPFADVDFANAMKESFRRWTPTMMEFADEHVNRAVVDYSYNGAWTDFHAILLHNGYKVTAQVINKEEIEFTWGDKE